MKLGRKGFMFAEIVVVAVVISTVLVTLFIGLSRISSAYEIRNKYYDIDCLYIAMEVNDILIKENTLNTLSSNNNVSLLYKNGYGVDDFIDFYQNTTNYNINSAYFVPFDINKLNNLGELDITQTFKDYITYLKGNIDFNEDYNYIIIIERQNTNDQNDCYYYALKLKY